MTTDGDNQEIALLSGPPSKDAVLNPEDLIEYVREVHGKEPPLVPKFCILGFFKEMYDHIEKEYDSRVIDWPSKKNPMFDSIHIFKYKDIDVSYIFPGIGAPNAAAMLEMMTAFGGKYFISLGGVGILTEDIQRGEVILPTKALRDEGTSFHYEEPSRYSHPSEFMLEHIRKSLREKNVAFHEGGTWTTDAFFRETPDKIRRFYEEGCLTVEMEASALYSVARFRDVHVGSIFTAGDCVAGPKWDARRKKGESDELRDERQAVLGYALEAFRILDSEIG
jgi:uridine phosphorylase